MNDWYETVKLNYCDTHTGTWDKMRDIVLYWAGMGVDGFRCDMVELVPVPFMAWLIAQVKKVYPSVLFIAEVYEKEKYRMYVEEVGFDFLYDKSGLYDTLRAVTCSGASARGITWNWQFLGDLQPHMLNFLENHDEQRLASDFFCGKPEKGYAALAVSLLLNDAPFMLYFGQEMGERGMQKEGFSGLDGRTSIFDWCKVPALSKPNSHVLSRYSEQVIVLCIGGREALEKVSMLPVRHDMYFVMTDDLSVCDSESFLIEQNTLARELFFVHDALRKQEGQYLGEKKAALQKAFSQKGGRFAVVSADEDIYPGMLDLLKEDV